MGLLLFRYLPMKHIFRAASATLLLYVNVKSAGTPVLRKDFIFDSYQVYEARAYGADAILLIVSILTLDHLKDLMELAQRFWMQCLVEVHNSHAISHVTPL